MHIHVFVCIVNYNIYYNHASIANSITVVVIIYSRSGVRDGGSPPAVVATSSCHAEAGAQLGQDKPT